MPTQQQPGFLDRIGIGAVDEETQVRQAAQQGHVRNQRRHDVSSGVAGLLGGIMPGVSRQQGKDKFVAQQAGITPAQLAARREIRSATANIPQDGSFESRMAVARQAAKIANRHGDMGTVSAALQQVTQIEQEQAEFDKLNHANRDAKYTQDVEESIGLKARLNTDSDDQKGRAVMITEGPDAGLYNLIRPNQEDLVVRGGDLVFAEEEQKLAALKRRGADDQLTLKEVVEWNVGTKGNLPKIRSNLSDMAKTAQIVGTVADNLLSVFDPQGVLAATGKASIAADKTVAFVESASSLLVNPKQKLGKHRWENEDGTYTNMSPGQQHARATDVESGVLLSYLQEAIPGLTNLQEALPASIRENSLAAEQYWANIMELAYLDARLKEPSNRGLSDNDIKNALKRIGADTASPVSFATRQLQLIEGQLLPALDNLGTEFTVLDSGYVRQDIIDQVYNKHTLGRARDQLMITAEKLKEVIANGDRGNPEVEAAPVGNPDFEDMTLEELEAEYAGES